MATSVGANNHCFAEDNGEDLFPFADKADANAATNAAKKEAAEWDKAMAKWDAENPSPLITGALINSAKTTEAAKDAELESQRPIPFISALIRFAKATLDKATLDPHTTDSTTLATRIVNKVVKAREMETCEKQK